MVWDALAVIGLLLMLAIVVVAAHWAGHVLDREMPPGRGPRPPMSRESRKAVAIAIAILALLAAAAILAKLVNIP
jgi:flagellin-like protein